MVDLTHESESGSESDIGSATPELVPYGSPPVLGGVSPVDSTVSRFSHHGNGFGDRVIE
ncbi:hypothetical protein GLAREA_12067 [Glarea lozoyensis ATCC 20868]|uniref:Uncharacterized protein n=1 Tax=Glarea lozoyensis (strain ATCC 20868 / MF5171) TaxID=1116229 RepID=S3D2D3_GLAL2|nr:uncharacterized protein GLAREA_12067 [Glarea lozoyensis ATCC 20868]EPE31985.1 hypothetical protein GLAREA_12067 [Glarea lozoyensis ATCC 20868]